MLVRPGARMVAAGRAILGRPAGSMPAVLGWAGSLANVSKCINPSRFCHDATLLISVGAL